MKFLITGGAGFIGSYLSEKLLAEGHEVIALDNLSTGTQENIAHLTKNSSFHFVEGSVMDKEILSKSAEGVQGIFHLAAAVGVKFVMENLVTSMEVNVKGTENVLETALKLGGIKVLITSSSEVYGKSSKKRFHEEDDLIIGPPHKFRWSYATSKLLDEFLALSYHAERNLPVTIVRLFNICGPRQTGRYGMVIPRFVRQALKGEPITVYGSGKQLRSFAHVKDAVEGMAKLMLEPAAEGKIFNLGNPRGITIEELAIKIKEMTRSKSPITYLPYEEVYGPHFEDLMYRVPDINHAKAVIGFMPRYHLEDILTETVEYFRSK
ncbi:MAG: SDR family NAD(P)-dependent oxidoreductase [Caldiserica bacterium]|nr:SDR family NAD(P)-dependent oxidoreductase [Caldisericota bacterium]